MRTETTSTNLQECIDCGKPISQWAESCPNCGCPGPAKVEAAFKRNSKGAKKDGSKIMTIAACLVIIPLILFGALIVLGALRGGGSPTSDSKSANDTAWRMSSQFVEKSLEPKPAKFPNPNDTDGQTSLHNGDGSYSTRGYVDTVNAFNGPVRRYWSAKVRDDGNRHWTCEWLNIE